MQARFRTNTRTPLVVVRKSGEGGFLGSRSRQLTGLEEVESLPREIRKGCFGLQSRGEDCRTYPSKVQCQHEHEMGGEYNEEVPRCVLRNSVQNGRDTETRYLRLLCQVNNQRKREEIWFADIISRVGAIRPRLKIIPTYRRRGRCSCTRLLEF